MYKCFSNLVNDFKGLRKRFEKVKLVKTILKSLLDSWTIKVMIIKEYKDLSKMGLDELIGSLLTCEIKRKLKGEETKALKDITLKVVDAIEEEGNSSMDENDMSLLAKRSNKYLSRSKRNKRKKRK